MHQVVVPTTTWAPVARVSAAHPGDVARPVFCGIGSSTAVPTRPVFNGIGSSIAVPTPGAGFALTRATTWAPVARVSAAHPGGCGPARFLWHRFINRRANPAIFQWPSSFNRRANPGCGLCPYPGYDLGAGNPGKRSAPGGCGPARFLWHRFIYRRANPGPFSMAVVVQPPCQPRMRALPLSGLPVEFDGVRLAGVE